MTDILQRSLAPSDDAIESAVDDETIILHLKNGTCFGLDSMGTRIWALLKDGMGAPANLRTPFDRSAPTSQSSKPTFASSSATFQANDIVVEF